MSSEPISEDVLPLIEGGSVTISSHALESGSIRWKVDTADSMLSTGDMAMLAGELLRRSHSPGKEVA